RAADVGVERGVEVRRADLQGIRNAQREVLDRIRGSEARGEGIDGSVTAGDDHGSQRDRDDGVQVTRRHMASFEWHAYRRGPRLTRPGRTPPPRSSPAPPGAPRDTPRPGWSVPVARCRAPSLPGPPARAAAAA